MQEPRYWFPAKSTGLGWGLPTTWEGWAVIACFVVLLGVGRWYFPPQQSRWMFSAWAAVLVLVLLGVCYAKGEPLGR